MKYRIGSPVVENFVDREGMRRRIRDGIGSNNYAFIGLRRTGKTSLALKICEELKDEMIPVYLDVSFIAPLTEKNFLKIFASEVVERYCEYTGDKALSLKFKRFMGGAKDALVDILKGSRINIGELAEVYFKTEEDLTSILKATMELPEKLAKETGKDFIIVLDEFTRLLELNDDDFIWALRSHIHMSDNVHYIISGSVVSSMRYLLENKSPFFGTLLSMNIHGLEEGALDEFVNMSGIDVSDDAKRKIQEMTGLLPLYLQAFFHVAETNDIKEINEKELGYIKTEVFDILGTHFDYYFQEVKGFKRSVLIEMASEDLSSASELADALGKTTNYLNTYLSRLEKEGFVEHLDGGYELTDPFFKLWIKSRTE